MWSLKKIWYRVFQTVFGWAACLLPWRRSELIDGAGSIKRIPQLLSAEEAAKPLVVTDPGLMKAGVAPKVLGVLNAAGVKYALYDAVEPNPSVRTVGLVEQLYRKEGCDSFLAIGGGSSMDAAKAAAARIARPGKSVQQLGGLLKVRRRIPAFIAVPTTAGTGSETTIAALVTDTDTHHKYAIMDLSLIPRYAVLDAELTVGLPPHITAATGMDALTHAVEAYLCCHNTTAETDRFAEEAVHEIFAHLEEAYRNGSNIAAREIMLVASYKSGFAFTRAGVGNVHAIAHTLGGLYNTPHGLANAVILPIVLEDYSRVVWKKLARLAKCGGIAVEGAGDEANAKAFIAEIRAMNERMGIPSGFDFIKPEDIPQMTAWALKEANPIYPVPVLYSPAHCANVIERIRLKPRPAHT